MAALASYLDARAHGGVWVVRIDDIDPPREMPGATLGIINCLKAHGLQPDRVDHQKTHSATYERALVALNRRGLLFRCGCTRATLGPLGTCVRDCSRSSVDPNLATSLRVSVPSGTVVCFDDLILGPQRANLGDEHSNFIVKRRDGLYAYQLAAACDDGNGQISHAIRGSDLLDSTYRQIYLQQALELQSPQYGHLPLVYGADGVKLSKQTHAQALDNRRAVTNLLQAASVLGLAEPPSLGMNTTDVLACLAKQWCYDRVPR